MGRKNGANAFMERSRRRRKRVGNRKQSVKAFNGKNNDRAHLKESSF